MEQYYLGFDAGTQSVKTAVYDIDMNLIVQDTNATILNYPHPGWVEMDADQYLHATVTGIRNCVTKMKEKNLDPDNIPHFNTPLYFWRWDHLRDCRC